MKNIKIIIPLVLVLVGGVYKFALAKPPVKEHHKVAGEVYVLPKDFLVNMDGGKFAKLGVALVLKEGYAAAPAAGGHEAPTAPPEGYGVLPQEAVIRSIVTDTITNSSVKQLVTKKGRKKITERIKKRILHESDVKIDDVLLTDVAVQ